MSDAIDRKCAREALRTAYDLLTALAVDNDERRANAARAAGHLMFAIGILGSAEDRRFIAEQRAKDAAWLASLRTHSLEAQP